MDDYSLTFFVIFFFIIRNQLKIKVKVIALLEKLLVYLCNLLRVVLEPFLLSDLLHHVQIVHILVSNLLETAPGSPSFRRGVIAPLLIALGGIIFLLLHPKFGQLLRCHFLLGRGPLFLSLFIPFPL